MSIAATVVNFAPSTSVPLALGFFGLGTGYLIYGPQELAGFPALFFVLAAAGAMDIDLAFTLSKWTGVGLISAYGFLAGRLSGSGLGGALLHAASVGGIGAALIGLKALVH